MSRVLISGYYGFGNAGDEAVLAALLGSLRRQSPEIECEVLSAAPNATRRLHGVTAYHRARPRELLHALHRCDLFISGGGSLLQDVTSFNSLLYYITQIALARSLRRRVMIYAQGIGPLRRPAARRLVARCLRGVNWITVRDTESAAELRRLGLKGNRPPVEVTADPVFALTPAPAEWAEAELSRCQTADSSRQTVGGDDAGLPSPVYRLPSTISPRLGISIREWPGMETWIEPLADVIREAAGEMGLQPVYFPLQRVQDEAACRRLAERAGGTVLPGDYTPAEWMALAGRMDLLLGMRLHALIFAAAAGVPVVGLAYDPKVTALLARLGHAPALDLQGFDTSAVRQALREMWNGRVRCSVQIREAASELSAAAEINARRASALLERGSARVETRTMGAR